MILLPLRPVCPTHKNPQRRNSSVSVPKDAKIDPSKDVFVEYPVHVISVAVLVAVV